MIFEVELNDFKRLEGVVFFTEDELQFDLYKVSDKTPSVVFKATYTKTTPENTILFMEQNLIYATRIKSLDKGITVNIA